jgi:tRNA pseudouridine38-40 synthase
MGEKKSEEGVTPSSLFLFESPDSDADEGVQSSRMNAIRMAAIVNYRGSAYRGFAEQPSGEQVAKYLRIALSTIFQEDIQMTCAGRTDVGVHAITQVVSFDVTTRVPRIRLERSLERLLPSDIGVSWIGEASSSFDARHSARFRRYVYRVSTLRGTVGPIDGLVWTLGQEVDLAAIRNGALSLIGHYDFAAFCKSQRGVVRPTRREVFDVDVAATDLGFDVSIVANSFCQQMCRGIVGLLAEVGIGKRPASDVWRVLQGGRRSDLGRIAPPDGLYLYRVGYGPVPPRVSLADEPFRFAPPGPDEVFGPLFEGFGRGMQDG